MSEALSTTPPAYYNENEMYPFKQGFDPFCGDEESVQEANEMSLGDLEELADTVETDETVPTEKEDSLMLSLASLIPVDEADIWRADPNPAMRVINATEQVQVDPDTGDVIDTIREQEGRLFGRTEDRFAENEDIEGELDDEDEEGDGEEDLFCDEDCEMEA